MIHLVKQLLNHIDNEQRTIYKKNKKITKSILK